jgi:hypothetical protein
MRTEVELCKGEAPLLRRQERGDSLRQKRRFLDFESQRNRIGKTTTRSEQSLLLKRFEQCGVASVFVILIVESIFFREESNNKRSREKEKKKESLACERNREQGNKRENRDENMLKLKVYTGIVKEK